MAAIIDPIATGIKMIIKEKGLVQRSVALRAGFTEQQFSDMLNGRKIIKAWDLTPISKALGVKIPEIYDKSKAVIESSVRKSPAHAGRRNLVLEDM